jgi:hypothetical protein
VSVAAEVGSAGDAVLQAVISKIVSMSKKLLGKKYCFMVLYPLVMILPLTV